MTQATPNTCTIFCTHTHIYTHTRARTHAHTCIRAGSDNTHTHTHTASALSLCALKFQFLCLKVKERTKGRGKQLATAASHLIETSSFYTNCNCYAIIFHFTTAYRMCHAPFCCFAPLHGVSLDVMPAVLYPSELTTLIHERTRPHTYAQLYLCKSGSVRVCVWLV